MINIRNGAIVTVQTYDAAFQTFELKWNEGLLDHWEIVGLYDSILLAKNLGYITDPTSACYAWVYASDIINASNSQFFCTKCNNVTDPYVCHCGESAKTHNAWHSGHLFVPMGCTCGYSIPPEKKYIIDPVHSVY